MAGGDGDSDAGAGLDGAARADLTVAAVAAGATVALVLALRALGRDPGVLPQAAPLGPYFLHLLVRADDREGVLGRPLPWAGLSALAALAVFCWVLL